MNSNDIGIVYRDPWIVALEKPSGIGIHPSKLIRDKITFVDLATEKLGQMVYPVHRLDRATSGILLFALDSETASVMGEEFRNQRINKEYILVTRGYAPNNGTIDIPLKKYHMRIPKEKRIALPAQTCYETIMASELPFPGPKYPQSRFSLVNAWPQSGRYHQLRRHFSSISHPIIGDTQHGDTKMNNVVNNVIGHTRLLLHCRELRFRHPVTGESVCVSMKVPDDMQQAISALNLGQDKY